MVLGGLMQQVPLTLNMIRERLATLNTTVTTRLPARLYVVTLARFSTVRRPSQAPSANVTSRYAGRHTRLQIRTVISSSCRTPHKHRASHTRVMRDVTPPGFKLRYVLRMNGKRVQSGEADLSNMNCQMNPSARIDRYGYEEAQLEDRCLFISEIFLCNASWAAGRSMKRDQRWSRPPCSRFPNTTTTSALRSACARGAKPS
jgi:hypothetical protein